MHQSHTSRTHSTPPTRHESNSTIGTKAQTHFHRLPSIFRLVREQCKNEVTIATPNHPPDLVPSFRLSAYSHAHDVPHFQVPNVKNTSDALSPMQDSRAS